MVGKGHWLVCAAGHRAFQAKRDLWSFDQFKSTDFEPPKGYNQPGAGEQPVCPICGAGVVVANREQFRFGFRTVDVALGVLPITTAPPE
jgi:hypothetical protein